MRRRLRPKYSDEELARIYATPHDHSHWHDHKVRVKATIVAAQSVGPVKSVADLSCGDAAIAKAVDAERMILGDFAPGYEFTGPIEETIHQIEPVDMFILSETLEHLDDPDIVLKDIRYKTSTLVLSTPLNEATADNPEHYWAWDSRDLLQMLADSGFDPILYQTALFPKLNYYGYQIWVAQ